MKRNDRTGSRLFFIEFLIVLFFFLIVSTVCLRLFARAHIITRRADILSHAQAAAASVAAAAEETVTDADADMTGDKFLYRAAEMLPDAEVAQGQLTVSYDRDFRPCAAEDAEYTLTASVAPQQQEALVTISVSDTEKEPVYELSVTIHRPLTRKEALS